MKVCLKLAYCALSSSPSIDVTMCTFWGFFLHFLLKLKPFEEFFPCRNLIVANLSVK